MLEDEAEVGAVCHGPILVYGVCVSRNRESQKMVGFLLVVLRPKGVLRFENFRVDLKWQRPALLLFQLTVIRDDLGLVFGATSFAVVQLRIKRGSFM